MWDKVIHKWLRVPYTLHVHTDQRVKKPRATILLIHGIGSSSAVWNEVIAELPNDIRLVSVDLLGFGKSAQPDWAIYDVKTQARSVLATYLKLRLSGRVVIVGHSLGALVAVEIARRYPILVRSLVLYGPPFYKPDEIKRRLYVSSDKMLRDIYTLVKNHPDETVKIGALALRLGLVNKNFQLTHDTAPSYMNALEASIINQTSLRDALALKLPIRIIYGRLDPVVLLKNLRYLEKNGSNVVIDTIFASHEIEGATAVKAVVKAINDATSA